MLLNMSGGCIIAGGIARDAEMKKVGQNGLHKTTFSIAYGRDEEGKAMYANCVAWRDLADIAADIKKGDYVMAAGHIEQHEYNGKTYKSCVCDYISISRKSAENSMQPDYSAGFTTVDNGELPF